jgi:hypothetical protein
MSPVALALTFAQFACTRVVPLRVIRHDWAWSRGHALAFSGQNRFPACSAEQAFHNPVERDDFSYHHPALSLCLSMFFSEKPVSTRHRVRGRFSIIR